ncbi:MAG: SUMF1/EgtB/PvdO family nonheme iron enzyme [Chloroflexota bacterium]
MSNLIGQSLGRYHILEQLGEGGMATVYKAYDTRLETDVAVKVIRTENILPSVLEKSLKRFEREAKSLAKLTHTNIVKVTDYGEHEGKPYLVMSYLPGGTLKERLRGGPLDWEDAVRLLLPVAHALEYAHQQNLIHRDVKPSNILLTESGQPMLTDFGVAKLFDMDATADLTGTGMGVGTPEYMAPEQWTGNVGPQTDVYALGLVLYEMVTGRKPYTADTPAALLLKQANDPLPRPRNLMPSLPDAVEKVVLKALAKKTEDRYQDMRAFADALDSLVNRKGAVIADQTKTAMTGLSQTSATVMEDFVGEVVPSKRSGRKMPWMAAAGITFACCVLGVAGILVWRMASPPVTSTAEVPPITLPPVIDITDSPAVPVDFTITPDNPLPQPITDTPISITITPTEMTGDGAALVRIPAGKFRMGSNRSSAMGFCETYSRLCDNFADVGPQHVVYLDEFWIDQYEVTNAQFAQFVSTTGYVTDAERAGESRVWNTSENSNFVRGADWRHPQGSGDSIAGMDNHPVVQVSWNDANAYCTWAGRRLPTEAEWEKAARANTLNVFPWGSSFNCSYGNYDDETRIDSYVVGSAGCDGYARTAPVGSFSAGQSPYGVYDMSGNVWEWVADWFNATYYSVSPENNPRGPSSGSHKILRGGSWFSEMKFLYIPYRDGEENYPDHRDDITGFRCAVSQ